MKIKIVTEQGLPFKTLDETFDAAVRDDEAMAVFFQPGASQPCTSNYFAVYKPDFVVIQDTSATLLQSGPTQIGSMVVSVRELLGQDLVSITFK
jgi:hypothetical protein